MPKPPRYIYLPMLCLLAGLFGCTNMSWKEGRYFPFISPLPAGIPTAIAIEPPRSTPLELLPPLFEEPSSIPPWARPVAPENSGNRLISPDARYLIYLSGHPGTRYTSLYSTPLAGGSSVRLNRAVFADSIFYPTISPDSTRIIYYPSYDGSGLYSVTITGTEPITLTTSTIREAVLSADGKWVVYWGEDETGEHGLYSVPPAGGKPIWLGDWLPSSGSFQITPDSLYVVFVSAEGYVGPGELYSVPIQGGEQVHLNPGVNREAGSPVFITPDSQTVVFGNLYAVPIQGGALRQLNTLAGAGLPEYDTIESTQLSPDGGWLLYRSGAVQGNWRALFSVPVTGGTPIQLNGAPADGEGVRGFQISADSQYVLYQQGPRDSEDLRSFRVALSGGTPVPFPAAWRWIHTSPDSRWYVYGIQGESSGTDIYSVPVEGGTPVKLNLLMPRGSAVAWTQISLDSRTVYYATSKDAGGGMPPIDGFYQVPIEGGEAREVMGGDGRIPAFEFSFLPESQISFAEADYDGDGRYALYAYPPAPPPAPVESPFGAQTLFLPSLHH
jgi:Tol biopolymer transport system component